LSGLADFAMLFVSIEICVLPSVVMAKDPPPAPGSPPVGLLPDYAISDENEPYQALQKKE
jgi:hypothetical protein